MPPARDLLLQAARHGSEICHAEWCVRFQDVHPVVRDTVGLLGRDLGGAHIQTLVDLHGVRADYFAPELFGQRYAQGRFAGGRWAHHCHDRVFIRCVQTAFPAPFGST